MKEIELSQYLSKVGLDLAYLRDLSAVDRLNAIYAAHLMAFSYSNVTLRHAASQHPLKRSLCYEDYKSMFFESRGGYCFQLAAILKDVLIRFGYMVDCCGARVLMGAEVNAKEVRQLPPTHLILRVQIEDKNYLLDPGLGSEAPRLPILVCSEHESVLPPPDELKLYYLAQENVYVLERMTSRGWLRLIQTDLRPLSQAQIEFNLMRLEQHPSIVSIRDEKFLVGRILSHGRRSMFWLASSNQLKYTEKTTTGNHEELITDYDRAAELAKDKFNIELDSEELKQCCRANRCKKGFVVFDQKPIRPWTVEFPLDKRTILSMQSNLTPSSCHEGSTRRNSFR